MSDFIITVTDAGRAALVNAANTGTAPVTISQCGVSATAVVPSPTITALPGEIKRIGTLSGDVVADDTIHLVVRDESADVYSVRSFALYLADGTLFAIYGQVGVIMEKSSLAMLLLALDVRFADVAATALTFGDTNFLTPPATVDQQGVIELATTAEAQAGIDTLRALTPASAKAAILGWLLAQDGAGSGIDADLLDGQHGSWYADIPARLGYTPVSKTGDAMTGALGIGSSAPAGTNFYMTKPLAGSTTSHGVSIEATVALDVTSTAYGCRTSLATQPATFSLINLRHFAAGQSGIGAGSSVTTQDGFYSAQSVIGATNNYAFRADNTAAVTTGKTAYGFYSGVNIATGGGTTWGFYGGGTAWNHLNGRLGLGTTSLSTVAFNNQLPISGGTSSYGNYSGGTIQSDVTSTASMYATSASTQAAAFSLGSIQHYGANQGTFGAGSSVSNQYGFLSQTSLIGAANNYAFYANDTAAVTTGKTAYGFYSAINAPTGGGTTFGFRAAGTATNQFHNLTLDNALAVSSGGHGGTTAAAARTNLGLAIGSNVQAWDADLDAIAALVGASGILKKTAANAWALDTTAYLPSASYTAADVLAKIVTVDGAGSGLDADLLDGQHGAYYLAAANLTGQVSIAQGGHGGTTAAAARTNLGLAIGADVQAWDADLDGIAALAGASGILKKTAANAWALDTTAYLPSASYTAADVLAKLLTVDGAGSGVDADTLDGQHAAAFALAGATGVAKAGGWLKPTTGVITLGFNVASVTSLSSGGASNGYRAVITYTNPITNACPVVTGGSTNGSSAQAAYWSTGHANANTGFTICFGVAGGNAACETLSFITHGL